METRRHALLRSKSANLTTLVAVTPGTAVLMCARRAFSSAAALVLSAESPTRFSGMNALRMKLRQFPDDLAKIAHSAGVVPLFCPALMFAKMMPLCYV